MNLKRVQLGYSNYYKPNDFFELEDFFNEINLKTPTGFPTLAMFCEHLKNTKGIERIYYEKHKSRLEMLEGLIKKYFEDTNTHPDEIGALIYTRGSSTENEINIPYYFQRVFNMKNARVFNIEQTCTGSAISIDVAHSFIALNKMKKVLLISINKMEKHFQRYINVTIMSDGAGILEIKAIDEDSGDNSFEVLDYDVTTEGSMKFNLAAFSNDDVNSAIKTIRKGTQHINRFLEKHKLKINDIRHIIQQNISLMSLDVYSQLLGFPKEGFFLKNIPDGAHMGDVDLARNLTDFREMKKWKKDELAFFLCIGWGTSWATILIRV